MSEDSKNPLRKAIEELADKMWRVHPSDLDKGGYIHISNGGKYENPRVAWYADQIAELINKHCAIQKAVETPFINWMYEDEADSRKDDDLVGVTANGRYVDVIQFGTDSDLWSVRLAGLGGNRAITVAENIKGRENARAVAIREITKESA